MKCERCQKDCPNEMLGSIQDNQGNSHIICRNCYMQINQQNAPNPPQATSPTTNYQPNQSMPTKPCKNCGNAIHKKAVICPKCGAKQKKPFYKTVWFWIIIVLVIIISLGFGTSETPENHESSQNVSSTSVSDDTTTHSNETETTMTTTTPSVEYMSITVDDLENALDENAALAKETYCNKNLAIRGKLHVIDSDLKYISITSLTQEYDFIGVQCYIKNKEIEDVVKTLKKGEKIIVKGEITSVGEVLGYFLDIDEIEIE